MQYVFGTAKGTYMVLVKILKKRHHSEGLGVYVRIILKCIFK